MQATLNIRPKIGRPPAASAAPASFAPALPASERMQARPRRRYKLLVALLIAAAVAALFTFGNPKTPTQLAALSPAAGPGLNAKNGDATLVGSLANIENSEKTEGYSVRSAPLPPPPPVDNDDRNRLVSILSKD